MKQISLFNEDNIDPRSPVSVNWNLWHGCTRVSDGCRHCYVYRRDESIGKDPSIVHKTENGSPVIKHVSVGGESGPGARVCDYSWVEAVHAQCTENGISFYYHQTGAKLIKDGKLYDIPRKLQHSQAHKAGLDS